MSKSQQEIATPAFEIKNKVRSQSVAFGTTRWLTYTALLTALALMMKVIGQIGTLSEISKLTLIYTVWLVAAAVLGPIGGGTVCFISDLLIALVFPTGVLNPFITLVCTLYGVFAGLIFKYLPTKHYSVKFIVAGLSCAVVCTFVLDSLAIWGWCKYYLGLKSFMSGGKNGLFGIYMLTRLFQLGVAAANTFIAVAMIPLLTKLKLLPPTKKAVKNKEAGNA
ncbi:MAG: ECF transporter S component [Clostridiales bacterium]|nr:ECF transporter S component [Clostridiales bacterium]